MSKAHYHRLLAAGLLVAPEIIYGDIRTSPLYTFQTLLIDSYDLPNRDGFIMNSYFTINKMVLSNSEAYGLDTNQTVLEKVSLIVAPVPNIYLRRVFYKIDIEQ